MKLGTALVGRIKNLIRKALVTLDRKTQFGQCSFLGTTSNYETIKPYGIASIPRQSDKPLIVMLNVMGSEEHKIGFEYNNKLPFENEEMEAGEVCVYNPTSSNYVIFKNDGECRLVGEKVAIGNSTTELLKEISDFLNEVAQHIHPGILGPTGVPSTAANFTAIKAKIDAITGTIS